MKQFIETNSGGWQETGNDDYNISKIPMGRKSNKSELALFCKVKLLLFLVFELSYRFEL